MSLFAFAKKQFIDVIQWTETKPGVLAYRYPMEGMEIQNGGQLVVRDTQAAMFANEGKVADVFEPGTHTLTTRTLPILTYLQNWDKAFESPFKSDVYFFSLREQTNQSWGTAMPVTIRDKEFGVIRLRANGIYSYKIKDIQPFWTKLSGTTSEYTVNDLEGQLRATILTTMSSFLGNSGIAFIDMAANQQDFSNKLKEAIAPAFLEYGLELRTFLVQSLSLPEELQQHLDKLSSMGMFKDLNKYATFQAADSLSTAAGNPGGIAGAGVGMGAGVAMGQMMAGALSGVNAPQAAAAADPIATLEKLGDLLKKGVLTQAEFDAKKAELLQQNSLMQQQFNCPSCGAAVTFQSSISVSTVCPYCRSLLVRHDKDVELIGKMAELPQDISPFQIGTTGRFKNVGFTLIGRMKIGWSDGIWNEWFLVSDEGKKGWLAEAQGFLAISYETDALPDQRFKKALVQAQEREEDNNVRRATRSASGRRDPNQLVLGSKVSIGGNSYQVTDIKEAECIGSEGELPFVAPKGRKSTSIDLLRGIGEFASVECDEAGKVSIYLGEYAEFNDFHFANLRELPGWKVSAAATPTNDN